MRRSDLKEDALDLRRRELAATTEESEREREIDTKQVLLAGVGASNFR
jgi:hypothetical protein